MMYFDKVKRFKDVDINLPSRATADSAGYDFEVAEDIVIPAFNKQWRLATQNLIAPPVLNTLDDVANFTKSKKVRPTLVPTGVKAILDPDKYLEISVRSSCPLKYWLVLANGVGIIDSDYANNPSNDGEIFFQLINLAPFDIKLSKGEKIGQGIIKQYFKVDSDDTTNRRNGGFGSTSNG